MQLSENSNEFYFTDAGAHQHWRNFPILLSHEKRSLFGRQERGACMVTNSPVRASRDGIVPPLQSLSPLSVSIFFEVFNVEKNLRLSVERSKSFNWLKRNYKREKLNNYTTFSNKLIRLEMDSWKSSINYVATHTCWINCNCERTGAEPKIENVRSRSQLLTSSELVLESALRMRSYYICDEFNFYPC